MFRSSFLHSVETIRFPDGSPCRARGSRSWQVRARRPSRPTRHSCRHGRPLRATPVPPSALRPRPARCGGHARDERRGTQECGRSDRSAFARAGVCGRSGAELLTSSVVCCNPWGSTTAGQRAFARPGDMRGTSNISWRWDSFVSCTLASAPFAIRSTRRHGLKVAC